MSRHPKNLDFPAPRNPHKKRARERRSPKSPDSPSKNGKNPAIWTCAAPLMKSQKTRYRQGLRALPFRKCGVGNRKCTGFHKKRFKGIRESSTLTRGRHSRRTWASANATAHLSVPLALHYEALTSSPRLLAPRTSTGRPQGALTRHSRSTRAWGRVMSKRKKCRTAGAVRHSLPGAKTRKT